MAGNIGMRQVLQRGDAIAILALQGGFTVHAHIVERLGLRPVLVRTSADLSHVSGLILPGGESSVMLRLLERAHRADEDTRVRQGRRWARALPRWS